MYYFAYGSCMDTDSFTGTISKEHYEVLGRATLQGYKLIFSRYSVHRDGGVADIIPAQNELVEGVLYDLSSHAWEPLDEREGVPYGIYERIPIIVDYQGKQVKAHTYSIIDKSEDQISPSLSYTQLIYNGAHKYLSESYRQKLIKSWHSQFGIDYFLKLER